MRRVWKTLHIARTPIGFREPRTWLVIAVVLCAVRSVHDPLPLQGQPTGLSDAALALAPSTALPSPAQPEPPPLFALTSDPRPLDRTLERPDDLPLAKPIWDWLQANPRVGNRPGSDEAISLTPIDPITAAQDRALYLLDISPVASADLPVASVGQPLAAPPHLPGTLVGVIVSSDPPASGGGPPDAGGPPIVGAPLASIPEPTGISLLGICVLMICRRPRV